MLRSFLVLSFLLSACSEHVGEPSKEVLILDTTNTEDKDKIVNPIKYEKSIDNLKQAREYLKFYGLRNGLNRISTNEDTNDNRLIEIRNFNRNNFTCVIEGKKALAYGSDPENVGHDVSRSAFHQAAVNVLKTKEVGEIRFKRKEHIEGQDLYVDMVAVIAGNKFFGLNTREKFYCYVTYPVSEIK
jgi:hypothetical protein